MHGKIASQLYDREGGCFLYIATDNFSHNHMELNRSFAWNSLIYDFNLMEASTKINEDSQFLPEKLLLRSMVCRTRAVCPSSGTRPRRLPIHSCAVSILSSVHRAYNGA